MERSKQSKPLLDWRVLLVEFLSVVIGVLIALAVDEWNEDRQNQNKADLALDNIRLELKDNLDILEYLHPNNLAVMSVVFDSVQADTQQNFLPGIQLQETAWQTLMSTGVAAYIPYEELFQVSQIYTIQEIYKRSGNQILDSFVNSRSLFMALEKDLSDEEIFESNRSGLEMMMYLETNLLEALELYLKDSESEN